jgi:HEAT repeat protein
MKEAKGIVALLRAESPQVRIAAAIVIGELRLRSPGVVEGLLSMVESGVVPLQAHALDALARVGARSAAPRLFPLLQSPAEEVRAAALRALASVGEPILPLVRARLASASPDERRALDALLADLGGKQALGALLSNLREADAAAAKAAALAVRQTVKAASPAERRSYLAETQKFLTEQRKRGGRPEAVAAALQILGYLEDERAVGTLLAHAADSKQAPLVRQEAIIGLRFALGATQRAPQAVAALLDAAAADDRTLAQTALHTLGTLALSAEHAARLEKLVAHPDLDRAELVLAHLGRQKGPEAARLLVKVLAGADRRRAEIAARELSGNAEALPLLARALLEARDPDRAWLLRNVLRPGAKDLPPAARKKLVEAAATGLAEGSSGWEAVLDVAREANPEGLADALRAVAERLRKKSPEKAMAALAAVVRTERATPEDRYLWAVLALDRGSRDIHPAARAADEALRVFAGLADRGFDVAQALRKERGLGIEDLFYVGFHFAELGHPVGEDLLETVVKKGGRSKLAKMAKNKLALTRG